MNFGWKKVYFLFLVRKPKSNARLKSDMALFRKPACLASSRDIRVKISATAAHTRGKPYCNVANGSGHCRNEGLQTPAHRSDYIHIL